MGDDVIIEKISDIRTLGDFVRKFDDSAPRPVSSRVETLDGYIEKLANHAENYCIIKNSEVAGFLSFYANRKDEAYLSMIAVDKACKRMGIGSTLLYFALGEVSRKGIPCFKLEVDNNNTSAIAFYKKHGFIEGDPVSDVSIHMRKDIVRQYEEVSCETI